MSIWAVIPVRPLEEGKSRLAAVLTLAERQRLNDRFFRQTLETAAAVVGKSRTLVVSRSGALIETAHATGYAALAEAAPHGLNEALTQAASWVAARGATTILTISCDLPFLIPDELRALLAAAQEDGVAIAGDRAGTGTNGLAVSPVGAIPYLYGADSFAAHLRAAADSGRRIKAVRRAGLMFDIDTPDDLEQMEDIRREYGAGAPGLAFR